MKKTGKILCGLLIVALIVIMIVSNNTNANTITISSAKSVTSGSEFEVSISWDIDASFINFAVSYDSDLFTYLNDATSNANAENWSINQPDESSPEVYCMYANTQSDSETVRKVTLKFKANNVSEAKIGTISINNSDDLIQIVTEDSAKYTTADLEGSPWSTSVQVNPNETTTPTPTPTPSQEVAPTPTPTPIPGDSDGPVLDKNTVSISIGQTDTVTADRNVEWSIVDSNVALVDVNGTIIGLSAGNTVVTATDTNGKKSYVTVVVTDGTNNGNTGNDGSSGDNGSSENNGSTGDNGSSGTTGTSEATESSENGGGSSSSSNSSGGSNSSSNSGSLQVSNGSSSSDEVVPATGESSVETIAILAVLTLIIASVIFRRKSRVK